ncbi:MAG: HAMP domain-containing histidine kinase [Clostridia bacterium]|nr:HAMP domain-containing histidine kinase [Clostridia bacterium]
MKKSIVKRWAYTVLASTVFVIVVIGVLMGLFIKNQYYDAVRMTLNSRATSLVMSYFNSQTTVSDELFNKMAKNFVDNFSDKNVMEVWVIDKNGHVVVSSTGFSVKGESYPDYNYAMADENGKGEWIGRMKNNEKVMALTYILPENSQGVNGAIRYIISLQDIDRQIYTIWILIGFLLILVICFVITSGAFFINSIINPVRKINETASKIATGDFNVSIEKHKYDDEIGQLCDTINNMAHEIGETERMKNDFISTVSHELRTPLTAIKGWGETIKLAQNDEELVNKGLDVIVNETERLSDLVEELLDFSRMESGKLSLKKSQIDIVKELTEVLEVFESRSNREGIDLNVDIPFKSIIINGDKNRLKQSFVNIIDNSFKYTSKGGYVNVKLRVNNSSVFISIKDNGCGISKHDLPKIRQKFYKANNSARGSGIGLAVTDEIIKLHEGEMIIESEIGVGTTVSIILPRNNK